MATATLNQGKTSFVKQFLTDHPDGTTRTVNEAWTAAGMNGTISHPVISAVRKQLGLTANLPAKTRKAAKQEAAAKLPRTASAPPGKASFVKQFLNDHPDGTTKTVNEAWRAAGFKGTISPTSVNKTRLKLTGKRRGKTRTAAKGKAAPRTSRTATATLGKTSFVKEFLNDHPESNVKAVNEAWTAAKMNGTISPTLVNKMRAMLGLTGNLRGETSKARTTAQGKKSSMGKKPGRPRNEPATAVNGQARGRKSARTLALTELEVDIDRLIFKVMGVGDLTEIEDSLRHARRVLYGALTRG
jgi:hypothetical protein